MIKINHLALIAIAMLLEFNVSYASEIFYSEISEIPENVKRLMVNKSWHNGCPLPLNKLAYIKLSYWGFDNKTHLGELIVYKDIARNTVDTFKELFQIRFPIESIQLPEKLPERSSISKDNNTSAFYCQKDAQSPDKYSSHSYGIAIDINPVYNPSIIANNKVYPESGRTYLDRNLKHEGMIKEGDPAFEILAKFGWYWGAYFPEVDYQHFQKIIIKHYLVKSFQFVPANKQILSYGITD
jgi:D-alanyl-D-alanine carboxypeptidase